MALCVGCVDGRLVAKHNVAQRGDLTHRSAAIDADPDWWFENHDDGEKKKRRGEEREGELR